MKKTSRIFRTNQITPGIQVNGGKRDRRQPAAHEENDLQRGHRHHRHVLGEHEQHVGRRRILDHEGRQRVRIRLRRDRTAADWFRPAPRRKNTTNIGNSGSQYQPSRPKRVSCARTMSDKLSEPAISSTVTITKPIETSYDTICAAERRADRKRVLRVRRPPAHDHAIDRERRDREDVERADVDVGDRPTVGDGDHSPSRQRPKGPSRKAPAGNTPLFAPAGMIGSFSTNFRRSAKLWNRPPRPDDVRSAPKLNGRPYLAIGVKDVGDRDEQDDEERHAFSRSSG